MVFGPGDLAIDGNRLMRELGLAPSPRVGQILRELVEVVTDDPAANESERLIAEARRLVVGGAS
jgi:hypothetical protein